MLMLILKNWPGKKRAEKKKDSPVKHAIHNYANLVVLMTVNNRL